MGVFANKGGAKSQEVLPNSAAISEKKDIPNIGGDLKSAELGVAGELTRATDKPVNKRLNVILGDGETPLTYLRTCEEINSKPSRHYIFKFTNRFGLKSDKISDDYSLREDISKLKDYELNREKRHKEEKEYLALKERIDLALLGYVKDVKEVKSFNEGYSRYLRESKFRGMIARKINDTKLSHGQKKIFEDYWTALNENDLKLSNKEITEVEHSRRKDELNEKIAKDSGDKDLQNEYKEYKEDLADLSKTSESKTVIIPLVSSDKPVDNKQETKQALAEVKADSFHLDLHEGGASVLLGPEKFPLEIKVFKNDQTNKFVYYFADHFAENGFARFESNDVSGALDGRYLDSYISKQLVGISDSDTPNKVPDEKMVLFAEKLLGDGKSRGYKVEGDNKALLDRMVTLLKQVPKDADTLQYSTFVKKIERFNYLFQKGDAVSKVKRLLLDQYSTDVSLDQLLRV